MHGTERLKKWGGKTAGVERKTRQQVRAQLRAVAFKEITAQYPGELHSVRRGMAIARARHDYHK